MSLAQQIFEKLESLTDQGEEFCTAGIHVLKFADDWDLAKINFRVYTGKGHCVEVICEDMDPHSDVDSKEYSFFDDFYDGFELITEEAFYRLISGVDRSDETPFTLRF